MPLLLSLTPRHRNIYCTMLLLLGLCLVSLNAFTKTQEGIQWQAPLGQDHTLTGRILEVSNNRYISFEVLMQRLSKVLYIVTGESHNNPDHHQLQLLILQNLFAYGRRVSLGLEVFTSNKQPALEQFSRIPEPDTGQLFKQLDWGKRRIALWQQFEPLLRFAGNAGLPLVALDISRREAAVLKQNGVSALPGDLVKNYALDHPLPEAARRMLIFDLYKGHCGMLFSNNLEQMILAQRTRDATMAQRMLSADVGDGALILTGYGHARKDRGIPYLLKSKAERGELVSILFASVQEERQLPADYRDWFGGQSIPFDYVWFTPRVDDEDPCEKLRKIYGKKSQK